MSRPVVLACILAMLSTPVAAYSNAANYLIEQEIAAACDGGGTMGPAAVIARDLTGDGSADLVISHEGIACSGGGRSNACGMQVCSVMIYVRRGPLLELEVGDLLGMMVTVGDGEIPSIQWYGHSGDEHSMKWNGREFR